MTRALLAIIAALMALLVVGRLNRHTGPGGPGAIPAAPAPHVGPGTGRARSAAATDTAHPQAGGATDTARAQAASGDERVSGTPVIDLLARAEARGRLARAAQFTYFDSLFAETDSIE